MAAGVLTTKAGAERLGGNAVGLEPDQTAELHAPDAGVVHITAVPAEHGSPEVAAKNGPVIGFVLRGEGLPTIYVSGDNASVEGGRSDRPPARPVRRGDPVRRRRRVPVLWGTRCSPLMPGGQPRWRVCDSWPAIVPIHQEGWEHFTAPPEELRRAFSAAGLDERLRAVEPGAQVEL